MPVCSLVQSRGGYPLAANRTPGRTRTHGARTPLVDESMTGCTCYDRDAAVEMQSIRPIVFQIQGFQPGNTSYIDIQHSATHPTPI